MYFKKFPQFLYDFNYGNRIKTSVVTDITRNIRLRRDILANVTLYDEVDIVDGETPEIIAEKYYGSPDYHWVVMLCNEKFDYRADFPQPESVLVKHIADVYNPVLKSTDWKYTYTETENLGVVTKTLTMFIRITSTAVPFDPAYFNAPIVIDIADDDRSFVKTINFPVDELNLDFQTQYFSFPLDDSYLDWARSHSTYTDTTRIVNTITLTDSVGTGMAELTIKTTGREFNPVYFVDLNGKTVNPGDGTIPITGDVQHRYENDLKRRIKLISPSLLETILRNYEDEL